MDIVTLAAARKYTDTKFVGFVPKGAYNPANENKYGEWYTHEGGSYAYINPTPSTGVPVTETTHWQQIASQGATGPSAYDAAVAGGYTGTEAEFNAANAGIEAARDAALDAAETANEAAENAETAAYRSMLWRKTASGNPVSVYPVPESPLYAKVSGTFAQAGTGDPSPSNIRTITPWLASGATVGVKRTGKCVLAHSRDSDTGIVDLPSPVVLKAGVTYRISTINKKSEGSANFHLTDGSAIVLLSLGWYVFDKTVTPSSDIVIYKASLDIESTTSPAYMWIEVGSTATSYEPYSGQEIALTAPQEIPAGWMDNEGKGQVTHGYIASYVDEAVPDGWVSSIGELSAGAQVVYPLATPIDITPSVAPLPALPQLDRVTPRQNVLTASTGNVELTYAKSPIQESDDIATAIAAL